jgi:hypothetical protein
MIDQDRNIVALMTVVAQKSYDNILRKSEASFGESDPQRLTVHRRAGSPHGVLGLNQRDARGVAAAGSTL